MRELVPQPVDGRRVLLAGVRELWPNEAEVAERFGIGWLRVEDLADSTAALVARLRERKVKKIALHVDVDVLDPGEFPAVGWSTPKGLSAEAVVRIVRDLSEGFELVCTGLAEYRPPEMSTLRALVSAVVDA